MQLSAKHKAGASVQDSEASGRMASLLGMYDFCSLSFAMKVHLTEPNSKFPWSGKSFAKQLYVFEFPLLQSR